MGRAAPKPGAGPTVPGNAVENRVLWGAAFLGLEAAWHRPLCGLSHAWILKKEAVAAAAEGVDMKQRVRSGSVRLKRSVLVGGVAALGLITFACGSDNPAPGGGAGQPGAGEGGKGGGGKGGSGGFVAAGGEKETGGSGPV